MRRRSEKPHWKINRIRRYDCRSSLDCFCTRDMTAEKDGLILRVLLYLAFGLVLFIANLIFDYVPGGGLG